MINKKTKSNRRQLFTNLARYATLGLVGVSGVSLAAKRRRLVKEHKCVNKGICNGCGRYNACGLPQAISAKRVLGNSNG